MLIIKQACNLRKGLNPFSSFVSLKCEFRFVFSKCCSIRQEIYRYFKSEGLGPELNFLK